jgi:REP element-mobilizing transposase RayT
MGYRQRFWNGKPCFTLTKYKTVIIESLKFLVEKNRIWLYGFVIMPNHIHLLWRMQEGFKESDVQRDFLKFTAQRIILDLTTNDPVELQNYKVSAKDREFQFWELRSSTCSEGHVEVQIKRIYIRSTSLLGKTTI